MMANSNLPFKEFYVHKNEFNCNKNLIGPTDDYLGMDIKG